MENLFAIWKKETRLGSRRSKSREASSTAASQVNRENLMISFFDDTPFAKVQKLLVLKDDLRKTHL
jgi:hypothetical protein